jgi:exodeoxyribonuclease VII small subunit
MSDQPNKTISQKMSDLNTLVDWFEGDDFELEKAVEKYQQTNELANEIESDLKNLRNEITVLKQKFDA